MDFIYEIPNLVHMNYIEAVFETFYPVRKFQINEISLIITYMSS